MKFLLPVSRMMVSKAEQGHDNQGGHTIRAVVKSKGHLQPLTGALNSILEVDILVLSYWT